MPELNDYIVVWCDSKLGLISTRTDQVGFPVTFKREEVEDVVDIPDTTDGVFAILKRRDGTKVGLPALSANHTFGWNVYDIFS